MCVCACVYIYACVCVCVVCKCVCVAFTHGPVLPGTSLRVRRRRSVRMAVVQRSPLTTCWTCPQEASRRCDSDSPTRRAYRQETPLGPSLMTSLSFARRRPTSSTRRSLLRRSAHSRGWCPGRPTQVSAAHYHAHGSVGDSQSGSV